MILLSIDCDRFIGVHYFQSIERAKVAQEKNVTLTKVSRFAKLKYRLKRVAPTQSSKLENIANVHSKLFKNTIFILYCFFSTYYITNTATQRQCVNKALSVVQTS